MLYVFLRIILLWGGALLAVLTTGLYFVGHEYNLHIPNMGMIVLSPRLFLPVIGLFFFMWGSYAHTKYFGKTIGIYKTIGAFTAAIFVCMVYASYSIYITLLGWGPIKMHHLFHVGYFWFLVVFVASFVSAVWFNTRKE